MLYKVVKGAFSPEDVAEVERIAAGLTSVRGATVENDDYSTRQCDLRWILYGTPGFETVHKKVLEALRAAGIEEDGRWECENLQYTAYGPGGFHNWHIDAYRRTYNQYDLPLGKRFIGKKRALSVSILLNDADCFTGGDFEVTMFPNGSKTVGSALKDFTQAGDMAVFDSKLCHRVAPVETGLRKSLVAWICA